MIRNPYNYTEPAPADMFFGRRSMVDALVQGLTGPAGASCALFGGRRIGKTTLLRAVARRLRDISSENSSMIIHVLTLDLGEADLTTEHAFFGWLERQVRGELVNYGDLGADQFAPGIHRGEAFKDQLVLWRKTVKEHTGRRLRLILLLDEFEHLVQSPWAKEGLPRLRGLLLSESSPLKIMAVGGRGFLSSVVPGSPLDNILMQYDLRGLDRSEALLLVNDPTQNQLPTDVAEAVLTYAGGHPCLIQYLMYHLWSDTLKDSTPAQVAEIASEFPLRSSIFDSWLRTIGKESVRIYRAVASSPATISAQKLAAAVGDSPATVKDILRVLAYHGLIEQTGTKLAAPYRTSGHMYLDWLAEKQAGEPPIPQNTAYSRLGLRVSVSDHGDSLCYVLHDPDGEYSFWPAGEVRPKDSTLSHYLPRIRDRLSTMAAQPTAALSADGLHETQDQVAAIGHDLYDQLLSSEVKHEYPRLKQQYAGKGLVVTSDEPSIPWEIIRPYGYATDGSEFYDPPLCESFQTTRWISGSAPAPGIVITRVAVACSPNLRHACREYDYFDALRAEGLPIEVIGPLVTVHEVKESLRKGAADLFHFACHGRFDAEDPADAKIRLSDGYLRAGDITGAIEAGVRKAKPLVVLNSCYSGESGHGLTRLDGWPERFAQRGASAFVGSLWEISDELAAAFAIGFYDRLWGIHGQSKMRLGEAFRQARLVIRDTNPENPTWLAYVLFGNPDAEVALGAQPK